MTSYLETSLSGRHDEWCQIHGKKILVPKMSSAFSNIFSIIRIAWKLCDVEFFRYFLNLLQGNLFWNSSNFPFLDSSRLFLSYLYSLEQCERSYVRCYGSKSSDIGSYLPLAIIRHVCNCGPAKQHFGHQPL